MVFRCPGKPLRQSSTENTLRVAPAAPRLCLKPVEIALPPCFCPHPPSASQTEPKPIKDTMKANLGLHFATLAALCAFCLLPSAFLRSQSPLPDDFNPGANGDVNSLAVQADGKILVGGKFTTLGGQPRNYLGRLNADGTLDSGFNPGADADVYCLAVQADGKILVGGLFTTLAGQPRNYIGRLNADGTLDNGFNPGPDYWVLSMLLQPDGKIVVGGFFTNLAGQARANIARLNADGTLDSNFNPGANGAVAVFAMQADGKILAGGIFTNLGGQPRNRIARLKVDGTLDGEFNPDVNNFLNSLTLQANGKILVGGTFTEIDGEPRYSLARLNPDGTLDSEFNLGANGTVYSLAVQADGRILVAGSFSTLGGQPRSRLARLSITEPPTQSLSCNGSSATWLRGGASPEIWRATFDQSTNGLTWTPLGQGSRIPGGWQLSGISLPSNGTIRARGCVTGGYLTASGWFVETLSRIGPALFLDNCGFIRTSNRFGFTINGTDSQLMMVEVSSNLTNWTSLSTNALTNGAFYFSDPGWVGEPQRFYRAQVWP